MQQPTNQYVTVLWEARAKAGKAAEMKSFLASVVTGARHDAGCIDYEAHEVEGQPGTFIILERWETRAALEGHLHNSRMLEKAPQLLELMEGSIEAGIRLLALVKSLVQRLNVSHQSRPARRVGVAAVSLTTGGNRKARKAQP